MSCKRIVTAKTEYAKNRAVCDKSVDSLLKRWLACGMLQISDVMNSGKEDILRTILDNVHTNLKSADSQTGDITPTFPTRPNRLEGGRYERNP